MSDPTGKIYLPCFDGEPVVRAWRDGDVVEIREARPPIFVRPSHDINKVFISVDGHEVLIGQRALTDAIVKCVDRSRGRKSIV